MIIAGLLMGCPSEDKTPHDTDPGSPTPVTWTYARHGQAPWDPVTLDSSEATIPEPLVLDATGAAVPMRALDWEANIYAWVPVTDLAAGTYTLAGADGEDLGFAEDFEVLPYGKDPAFSADLVLGATYQLDPARIWGAVPEGMIDAGIETLAADYELYLQLLSVDGEEATFQIVTRVIDTGTACVMLRDQATLSATGELSWARSTMEVETEAGTIYIESAALHLGWLGDGSAIGGFEGAVKLDTRVISTWVTEDDATDFVCFLGDALDGEVCTDCIGDGVKSCLDVRVHAGLLTRVETALGEDLPLCGLDLEEDAVGDLPSLSCDVSEFEFDPELDCSCATGASRAAALPLALSMLAALAGRRRSRRR